MRHKGVWKARVAGWRCIRRNLDWAPHPAKTYNARLRPVRMGVCKCIQGLNGNSYYKGDVM